MQRDMTMLRSYPAVSVRPVAALAFRQQLDSIYVMYGGSRRILYVNAGLFLVAIAGAVAVVSLFFPVPLGASLARSHPAHALTRPADAPANAEGSCYAWRSPTLSAAWAPRTPRASQRAASWGLTGPRSAAVRRVPRGPRRGAVRARVAPALRPAREPPAHPRDRQRRVLRAVRLPGRSRALLIAQHDDGDGGRVLHLALRQGASLSLSRLGVLTAAQVTPAAASVSYVAAQQQRETRIPDDSAGLYMPQQRLAARGSSSTSGRRWTRRST